MSEQICTNSTLHSFCATCRKTFENALRAGAQCVNSCIVSFVLNYVFVLGFRARRARARATFCLHDRNDIENICTNNPPRLGLSSQTSLG